MTRSARKVWHREDIKAEVRKSGTTLTDLALGAGLPENACRRALMGRHADGELAIAGQIKVPVWELWPDRWSRPRTGETRPVRIVRRCYAPKSRTNPYPRHCQKVGGA